MKFSENLKTQRIINGVKQEDIAILCDVTRSAVSNWENGRRLPHIDIIQSLAKFFNVTMEDLLGTDIKYVKHLEKESIVTPDEPKHFSKVPMIFALLTLVVVTLLTILIVPVVKDKYINNGNVNEVEYIDANSISKVSLVLKYYNETVSVDFEEYPTSRKDEGIHSDNGKVYVISCLETAEIFSRVEWVIEKKISFKISLYDEKINKFLLINKTNNYVKFNGKETNQNEELIIFICDKYSISFYISNNKYYLDVLQL